MQEVIPEGEHGAWNITGNWAVFWFHCLVVSMWHIDQTLRIDEQAVRKTRAVMEIKQKNNLTQIITYSIQDAI